MGIFKSQNGVTLVAIVVTIIIMVIISGITLSLTQAFLDDRITAVSNYATEAKLKEEIEMVYMDAEASYISEKDDINISKTDYYIEKIKEKLENIVDITDVTVSGNVEESISITLNNRNEIFNFKILSDKEIRLCEKIKGSVKVGDYFEYPVSYSNISFPRAVKYNSKNGWRIIDDGVMEGTSGSVKIISTDMPAMWYYEGDNNQTAVDNLLNYINDDNKINLIKNDIFGSKFNVNEFFIDKLATEISTLTLRDLNRACNACYGTSRKDNDTSSFEDSLGLFKLKINYWLATKSENDEKWIYCNAADGIYPYENSMRMGIRLVIYLKNDLDVELDNNVWKIVE